MKRRTVEHLNFTR